MNWNELVSEVATRTGLPANRVRQVLSTAVDTSVEALVRGEGVHFRQLGTLDSKWRAPVTVRSIADARKLRMDGRYVARFRPSRHLRKTLASLTEQHWRDPEHQAAWRVAEALVGDLELYHAAEAPTDLQPDDGQERVEERCQAAFGALWTRARETYDGKAAESVREQVDYLTLAARRRWSDRDRE